MSLEEYISSEGVSESGSAQAEKVKEFSEKFKETSKKASTGIKRVKKDEKKAKKHDMLLAGFLVKILLNKKYDPLTIELFTLIDDNIPSNFILGIMSLVYLDISDEIRNYSRKKKINFKFTNTQKIEFNDNNLDEDIKNRLTLWIEDINDILRLEYSSIMTKRLIKQIKQNEKIIYFIANVFTFFLKELNISIQKEQAVNIADYISKEVLKDLKSLKLEEI